jgi:hypothetical protein
MIRLEGGMLVLDSPCTKEDAEAIQEFAKRIKDEEQERIVKALEESFSHETRRELNSEGTAWSIEVHSDSCELCRVLSKIPGYQDKHS